jgi:FdhD protein
VSNLHQHGDVGQAGIPVSFPAITGAILAGGQSTRMGSDKALLELHGQRLLERVHCTMASLFGSALLITNSPERHAFLPCPAAPDQFVGAGSLAGIHAALTHAATEWVFVVACDMPLLSRSVISYLCSLRDTYEIVVPESSSGLEPLHALYHRSCLPEVEAMLSGSRKRIIELYDLKKTRRVPWHEIARLPGAETTFLNLNTPAEFEAITDAPPS